MKHFILVHLLVLLRTSSVFGSRILVRQLRIVDLNAKVFLFQPARAQ
jgi:hypothetical protein